MMTPEREAEIRAEERIRHDERKRIEEEERQVAGKKAHESLLRFLVGDRPAEIDEKAHWDLLRALFSRKYHRLPEIDVSCLGKRGGIADA